MSGSDVREKSDHQYERTKYNTKKLDRRKKYKYSDWYTRHCEDVSPVMFVPQKCHLRSKNNKVHIPIPGIEPGPSGWKPDILTTRQYGKSSTLWMLKTGFCWKYHTRPFNHTDAVIHLHFKVHANHVDKDGSVRLAVLLLFTFYYYPCLPNAFLKLTSKEIGQVVA